MWIRTIHPRGLIVLVGMWLLGVGTGVWLLERYAVTPGIAAAAPRAWPAESDIGRAPGRATLIMFAHPHCPCTRASIGELSRLMAEVPAAAVDAHVLFLKPPGLGDDWEQTDLWGSAAAIPGVQVSADDDGREARRFGSVTSGQTLLYDAAGRLLFSGGVTDARGHSGDNAGRSALVGLLTTDNANAIQAETAVFGCQLLQVADACEARNSVCPR